MDIVNSWNEIVSAALDERDGWAIAIAAEPIATVKQVVSCQFPTRYEYLARLVHEDRVIPAFHWIHDIAVNHPDKLARITHRVIEGAIAEVRADETITADINITAAILSEPQFPMEISQLAAGLDYKRIRFDLDLRLPLQDLHIRTLRDLKENFLITLDDFGASSNLLDLKRFQPDGLKLSAALVDGVSAFTNDAMQMANLLSSWLKYPPVIKGVGTAEQLEAVGLAIGENALIQGRVVAG